MFYNIHDIEQICYYCEDAPTLWPFAKLLTQFVGTVNCNSDGWAYWRPASRSAATLIELLDGMSSPYRDKQIPVDVSALRKAIVPMKRLLTKHSLPELDESKLPYEIVQCDGTVENISQNPWIGV